METDENIWKWLIYVLKQGIAKAFFNLPFAPVSTEEKFHSMIVRLKESDNIRSMTSTDSYLLSSCIFLLGMSGVLYQDAGIRQNRISSVYPIYPNHWISRNFCRLDSFLFF